MIAHIRYADLETNRLDEIYESTFWCYFTSHGDSTRMVHDPLLGKKKKNTRNNSSKSKLEHNQQEDTKEIHQLVGYT